MPCWLPWKQWQDWNFTPFFYYYFLPLLLKEAASPRQHFVLRSAWLAQHHFCISLLPFDKKVQQVPQGRGMILQSILMERVPARIPFSNSMGEAIFTFLFMESPEKGSTKAQRHLPLPVFTSGKKGLCTWMSGAMGSDTPSHSPGDPSSACSIQQSSANIHHLKCLLLCSRGYPSHKTWFRLFKMSSG